MPVSDITIRPARPGESAILTSLCIRSKAHWGYDAAFMAAAAPLLQIDETEIGAGRVLAALRNGDTSPCGVVSILPMRRRRWFELGHLFVAPEQIGSGVGRALFEASVALIATQGGSHVSILSDPNAAAFYEKLGWDPLESTCRHASLSIL